MLVWEPECRKAVERVALLGGSFVFSECRGGKKLVQMGVVTLWWLKHQFVVAQLRKLYLRGRINAQRMIAHPLLTAIREKAPRGTGSNGDSS